MIDSELQELSQFLSNHGIDTNAGLAEHELRSLARDIAPLEIPAQLARLYCWRDGLASDPVLDYSPFGFEWFPFSSGLRLRRDLIDSLPVGFQLFFPIGNSDGGLVVATLSEIDADLSQVFYYFPEEGELCLVHFDIQSLIRTALDWYRGIDTSPDAVRLRHSPNAWTFDQVGTSSESGIENVFDIEGHGFDGLVGKAQ